MTTERAPLAPISAEHITAALVEARADFDTFKDTNRAWLRENIPTLLSAIELSYEITIARNGIDAADAALQGAHLGGAAVRSSVNSGETNLEDCRDHLLRGRFAEKGLTFNNGDTFSQHVLESWHGPDAAAAIMKVKSPVARVMCSMVIGITICEEPLLDQPLPAA